MKLEVFIVEWLDPEVDDWVVKGKVLLYFDAPEHEVEHALRAVGLYAPRGSDTLEWGDFGLIRAFGDEPAIRLMRASDNEPQRVSK